MTERDNKPRQSLAAAAHAADGYWFAHDPETLQLEVYRDDKIIGTISCGDDEIGDAFADIVAHHRTETATKAPDPSPQKRNDPQHRDFRDIEDRGRDR